MPKLPSSQKVQKILESHGFLKKRHKGSHQRFIHQDGRKVTIIASKKEIPLGTLKSIARQSNIKFEIFINA